MPDTIPAVGHGFEYEKRKQFLDFVKNKFVAIDKLSREENSDITFENCKIAI